MKEISILIITYNRVNLLKRCLESIMKGSLPEEYELIVVINGYDKDTLQFFEKFSSDYQNLKFFPIQRTTKGGARNVAIKHAQGQILYFLDDDVIVDKDIFKEALRKFNHYPQIEIIGGPNLTPNSSSLFQRCSGYLLSSIFGAAKMRHRYIILPDDRLVDDNSLILCNLAMRKKVLDQEKILFNERTVGNEENLLLQQLRSKGYKILYSPRLIVYHHRRKTIGGFCEQFFRYGRGRMQMTMLLPRSFPIFVALPSLFLIYLISLLFFHNLFYLFPLFTYLSLDLAFSFFISIKNENIIAFPLLFILFPLGHISYGLGFLWGLR